MHTLYAVLLGILLPATLALAQPVRVNTQHPLAQGLLQWHLVLPLLSGGPQWWNLLGVRHGILTNMDINNGWKASGRPGSWGEMRFDESDDWIDLGSDPLWDFADQTFTFAARFRYTGSQSGMLLASRGTDAGSSGGYFVRAEPSGEITVRILTAGSQVVGERTTVRTIFADGLWHSLVVVIRTDTADLGNNDIAIFTDGLSDQTSLTSSAGTPYEPCSVSLAGCPLRVGAPSDNANQQFGGAMDDVRIWQRGLSLADGLAYHLQGPPTYGGLLSEEPVTLGSVTPRVKRKVTIQ